MFRLSLTNEPRWLELPFGVKVEVRPASTGIVEAARSEATKRVAMLQVEAQASEKAGQPLEKTAFNGANAQALDGLWQQYWCEALARYGIVRWEGVGDTAGAAQTVTAAAIEAFASHPVLSKAFLAAYNDAAAGVAVEGNASAPISAGSTEEAPITAPDAPTVPGALPETEELAVEVPPAAEAEPADDAPASSTNPKLPKAARSSE
jgi:hypothetical protein